ncbi:hypothetical protein Efla_000503 [Eimeria flavescens]
MKAQRPPAEELLREAAWSTGCPHWFWGSLLLWLPQPRLIEAISAKLCCMQHPRANSHICGCNRWSPCTKTSEGSRARQRTTVTREGRVATDGVVHSTLPDFPILCAQPSTFGASTGAVAATQGGAVVELSRPVVPQRSWCSSPRAVPSTGRVSPCSHPRLFTLSIGDRLLEEPQCAILSQQTQHKSPRLPPARKADEVCPFLKDWSSSNHAVAENRVERAARSRVKDTISAQDFSHQAVNSPHTSEGENSNGRSPNCPLLQDGQVPGPKAPWLASGGDIHPAHPFRNSAQLERPKVRTLSKGESTDDGDGATMHQRPAVGQVIIATAEHPEELFPQSVVQKKVPLPAASLSTTGREAAHPISDENNSFLAALRPAAPAPVGASSHGSLHTSKDKIKATLTQAAKSQTEHLHATFHGEPYGAQDFCALHLPGPNEQVVSTERKEGPLRATADEAALAGRQLDEADPNTKQKMQVKRSRYNCTISQLDSGRVLRSRTVAVSPTTAPGVATYKTIQRETTSVEKKLSSKAEPTRGRPREVPC